jgi:hypothetical protein
MVASPEDPFVTNPYIALEIQEPVELGGGTKTPGSVWKWLVAAVVIEAAKTVIMIIFHSSSPRVSGINIYAIGNLFLSGVMAVTMAWFLGRRSIGSGGHPDRSAGESADLADIWHQRPSSLRDTPGRRGHPFADVIRRQRNSVADCNVDFERGLQITFLMIHAMAGLFLPGCFLRC